MPIILIASIAILIVPLIYGFRGISGVLLFLGIFMALSGLFTQKVLPLFFLAATPQSMVGIIQIVSFMLLSGGSVFLAIYCNRFVVINFDPFDWLLGAILGYAVGLIGTYFFLTFSLNASIGSSFHTALAQSFMVHEFVEYRGWHTLLNNLYNLVTSEQKSMPDVK